MVLFPELSCPANDARRRSATDPLHLGKTSARGRGQASLLRKDDFASDVGRKPFGFGHEEIDGCDTYYEGQFKMGLRCGHGTLHSPDTGSRYVGQFLNEHFHGHGSLELPDGSQYTGQWRHGQKHGAAEYTSAEGLRYAGQWEEGRRHGEGEQEYLNGDRYQGWWLNGLCSGLGTYLFADGSRYDGVWASGRYDGPGTLYGADGSRERHVYRTGFLVKLEKLEPGRPPASKGARRDVHATPRRVVQSQTREDMHKPTVLPRPEKSKYLIRPECAAVGLAVLPPTPRTLPALPCSCTLDSDEADMDAPPAVVDASPELVNAQHVG